MFSKARPEKAICVWAPLCVGENGIALLLDRKVGYVKIFTFLACDCGSVAYFKTAPCSIDNDVVQMVQSV